MKHLLPLLAFLLAQPIAAQETTSTPPPSDQAPQTSSEPALQLHGSLRTDALVPQYDERIGTERTDNRVLSNSYLDLRLAFRRRYEAGLRAEYMKQPLPGFDPAFRGAGVPYFYATARFDRAEITLGSYYEQFGSGLVLRTYEEPSLGIDNHLRGLRLTARPFDRLRLKLLAGRQRNYWETDASTIYGADGEWEVPTRLGRLTLGASWVARREQPDALSRIDTTGFSQTFTLRRFNLVQPTNVSAFDLRAAWHTRRWQWLAEYAWKGQDPSFDNGYTYRHGSALLLSGSWSTRGKSFLLQIKRAENMSFRGRRAASLSASTLNHLPPFAAQPTYALTALYPYATCNVPGEWAFRAEAAWTLPRRTPWGGRYGTTLRLRTAHIRDLALADGPEGAEAMGTDGRRARNFWAMGGTRYGEWALDAERRLNRSLRLHATLLAQTINRTAVEGHGGRVNTLVGILEGQWQAGAETALRAEAQYLHTRQDQGDWWAGLLEWSLSSHFMFTLSDQFNARVPSSARGTTSSVHYWQAFATYTATRHRLQLGYGSTRAGYNCAGGVCRYVPAQKGFTLSYQLRF